jgi:hypothetical protein
VPTIDGPEVLGRVDPAPSFRVNPGANPYFAVELATDWRLFGSREERTENNFYGTWGDSQFGLIAAMPGQNTVFTLPAAVWRRLARAPAVYYRVLTVSERSPRWPGLNASTPDAAAARAPRIRVLERRQFLDELGPTGLARVLGSHALDDLSWDRMA